MTDYAERLHEKDEQKFAPMKLVSMLDMVGVTAHCDQCGRWQGASAITLEDAKENLSPKGWTFPGEKSICPVCSGKTEVAKPVTKIIDDRSNPK